MNSKCNSRTHSMAIWLVAILYIKVTVVSVCPGSFQALLGPLFFFFFDGFCFLCQLNCPNLFFFFWVLFSVSAKLPGPLFFFFFFHGSCFLCQQNCSDFFFFFGFCFLCQLNCPDLDGCIIHQVHTSNHKFSTGNYHVIIHMKYITCENLNFLRFSLKSEPMELAIVVQLVS
jgi:hypothetical protein